MRVSDAFVQAIKTIWNRTNLEITHPPPSDTLVRSVEKKIGKSLPESYVLMLHEQNGGYIARNTHPRVNGEVDAVWGIGVSPRPSIGEHSWAEIRRYMARESLEHPQGLELMLPFCGSGHYYVCLDYRSIAGGEPAVTFVDVELFEPAAIVSPNFERFVLELT